MEIIIGQLLSGAKAAKGVTVVIDVFRAFSVSCYLFDKGVKSIYTVADIALIEGNNGNQNYTQNPGYSGGWGLVVIYENPVMKSRAVTLFDGYAYVNGQLAGGGEYGNIDISGFTTVGSGPVNMKLGVMAAEGDRNLNGDYLAVQKLNANPAIYPGNYLVLNHSGIPPPTFLIPQYTHFRQVEPQIAIPI